MSLSAMAIGAAYGAMALGAGFTLLGIVIAGLGYALLGLITPDLVRRFGLHTVAEQPLRLARGKAIIHTAHQSAPGYC